MENIAVKVVKSTSDQPRQLQLYIAGMDFVTCPTKDSDDPSESFQIEGRTAAPEVMAGRAPGAASDVWGLGQIAS